MSEPLKITKETTNNEVYKSVWKFICDHEPGMTISQMIDEYFPDMDMNIKSDVYKVLCKSEIKKAREKFIKVNRTSQDYAYYGVLIDDIKIHEPNYKAVFSKNTPRIEMFAKKKKLLLKEYKDLCSEFLNSNYYQE